MTKPQIKETKIEGIPALQIVLDQTDLFPSEMLPDMVMPALQNEAEALWLTCHLAGEAIGLSYSVPEEMTDRTWNMLALAIRPDKQGQGLGAALVEETESQLREQGQRLLIVDTSGTDEFTDTRRFYARSGDEEAARIGDFWTDGDDKVVFRKKL